MELSPVAETFAQNEDNNVIGQEGDGNDASQSEEVSKKQVKVVNVFPEIVISLVVTMGVQTVSVQMNKEHRG